MEFTRKSCRGESFLFLNDRQSLCLCDEWTVFLDALNNPLEVKIKMPNAKVLSEKQAIVEALSEKLKNSSAGVLVDYKGYHGCRGYRAAR